MLDKVKIVIWVSDSRDNHSHSLVKSQDCYPCGSSGNCYRPSLGQTCSSAGVVCDVGYAACGGSCYSPYLGQTCTFPTPVTCTNGYAQCGNACYSTYVGQCCVNGIIYCIPNYLSCGSYCYSPAFQTCLNGFVYLLNG